MKNLINLYELSDGVILLKSASSAIKMEDKDLNAMSAVAFGENHPHKEVTLLKLNSCASKCK